MRILKRRILPATCPSTTCSLSSFTRNIAFGRASITSPSNSTLSSFATPYPIWRQHLSAWRPLVSCIELKLPARGRRRRFGSVPVDPSAGRRAAGFPDGRFRGGGRRGPFAWLRRSRATFACGTRAVARSSPPRRRRARFAVFLLGAGFLRLGFAFLIALRLARGGVLAVERLVGDGFLGLREFDARLAFGDRGHVRVPDFRWEEAALLRLAVHVGHGHSPAGVSHPHDGRVVGRVAVEPG